MMIFQIIVIIIMAAAEALLEVRANAGCGLEQEVERVSEECNYF